MIICADDSDYRVDKNSDKLEPRIEKELNAIVKKVASYINPLEMLKEEFKTEYSEEEIEKYSATTEPIILEGFHLSTASPLVITSDSIDCTPGLTLDQSQEGLTFSSHDTKGLVLDTSQGVVFNSLDNLEEANCKKYCPYCAHENESSPGVWNNSCANCGRDMF